MHYPPVQSVSITVGQRKKVTAVTFFPARPRPDQRGTNTDQICKNVSIIILRSIKMYAKHNRKQWKSCSPLCQIYEPTIISNYISKTWSNIQEESGWSTAPKTARTTSCKAWNSPVEYPSRESKHDIKESGGNMLNPIFKGNAQGRNIFQWFVNWAMKLLSCEDQRTSLMLSQHLFGNGLVKSDLISVLILVGL